MKKTHKKIEISFKCPCCNGAGTLKKNISFYTDTTTEEVKEMRKQGMTMQQIANNFNWKSLSVVDYHLRK